MKWHTSTGKFSGRLDAVLGVEALLDALTLASVGRAARERDDSETQTRLLIVAAIVEGLAGVAFILLPALTIALLFDVEPVSAELMIARIAGVALLSLGVACLGAATEAEGAARTWTVVALTLYNAGTGVLLIAFAARGMAGGPIVWIAGVVHLGLASALLTCTSANVHAFSRRRAA